MNRLKEILKREELWKAINLYADCRDRNPSNPPNLPQMKAVVEVESAVDRLQVFGTTALDAPKKARDEFREVFEAVMRYVPSSDQGDLRTLIYGDNGLFASKEAAWALAQARLQELQKLTAENEELKEKLEEAKEAAHYEKMDGQLV